MKPQDTPEWTSTWRYPAHKILFEWIPDYPDEVIQKIIQHDKPIAFRVIEYSEYPYSVMPLVFMGGWESQWQTRPDLALLVGELLRRIEVCEHNARFFMERCGE